MTTVLLVRHGLTEANGSGILAGWTAGVGLAEKGREQVTALNQRLAKLPIAAVISSPLERCQQTAAAIAEGHEALTVETDERLGECRYGDWEGQSLKVLAKDPLWKVVQNHPSAAQFPGGEALRDTQARSVEAIRAHNAALGDVTWVAVSHGDVIKAILADALGMHLDMFQRIQVDPASVSVVRYTELRPFVLRMNDTGGSVADLIPPKRRSRQRKASSDAVVGGGAGGTSS
jgi:probable phosphomutase (TIGR03848 family)